MNLLDDKYEILQPLKEGGMGAIYKVRHRLLDEIRVAKVMRPHTSEDPELRGRFLREAKMAIRVRHPNIGQLYDFSIDEAGTAVIVMEFIDGVTLQEILKSGPAPSLPFVIDVAVQTLQALSCLHFHGIVHRDVASDNVMLTRSFDGQALAKLIDLGIAKDPRSDTTATLSGTFLGKARYASPEQFRGDRADQPTPAMDLYSFGVLLYELLTGRLPIDGTSFAELAAGHLFQPPTPFTVTDPGQRIPSGLREAVLLALEKDPARRIASAQAFAESIRPFGAAGQPDPLELERLVKRARSAIPAASGRADPESSRLAARIDTVLDAVVTPFSDPGGLEILAVAHAYVRGQESLKVATEPHAERKTVATPQPRRTEEHEAQERDIGFAPRPRRVERQEEQEDTEEDDEEEERRSRVRRHRRRSPARPRLVYATSAAIGLLVLLGIAGFGVFNMLSVDDPLAGQIATVLGLEEDTETAVTAKLNRVVALIALLPAEDGRKPELGRERERLTNLQQLHVYVDRLAQLLEDTSSAAVEPEKAERAAADAENLWVLLREFRRMFAVDDHAASRIESRGRDVLRKIGERTDSERLLGLAGEP